jgi:hypothetical protein
MDDGPITNLAPNQGLELTGNSVRSCVALAIPRRSGPALARRASPMSGEHLVKSRCHPVES